MTIQIHSVCDLILETIRFLANRISVIHFSSFQCHFCQFVPAVRKSSLRQSVLWFLSRLVGDSFPSSIYLICECVILYKPFLVLNLPRPMALWLKQARMGDSVICQVPRHRCRTVDLHQCKWAPGGSVKRMLPPGLQQDCF